MEHKLGSVVAIGSVVVLGAFMLQGCGGGGAGPVGGGGTTGGGGGTSSPVGNSASVLAAIFQVDVNSGNVKIVSQRGSLSGNERAKPGLFTGNSVGFSSSVLTNVTIGATGLRSLQVSLVDNTQLPIGIDSSGNVSGLNVIFGGFVNTTGILDQRQNTSVSDLAGSTSGFADGSTSSARFHEPSGVAFGADGSLYVADFGNDRIRKIRSGIVTTLAGSGVAAETDGGSTTAAFNGPYAIASNPTDGTLVVCDFTGNKVRRVTSAGVVETIAGTGVAGGANGAGNVATFTNPSGLAVDSSGNIYVSESSSNRIRKIVLSGGSPGLSTHYTVTTYAGNGTGGHVDGAAASAEFFKPFGLACDSNQNLYVSDFENNAVREIDPSGNVTTIAGTGTQSDLDGFGNAATFNHPFGIAFANGGLFVTDSGGDRVREVVPVEGGSGGPISWAVESLAGAGSAGNANGTGSAATFDSPFGIAANQAENLFVADFLNNQIREVNPSTGTFPILVPNSSSIGEQVELTNPTGYVDDSDLGSAPYISYGGSLNPGQTSTAQPWNFIVPPGVTSFQFQVMVETNTAQMLPLQSAVGSGSPLVDVRTLAGSTNGGRGLVDGPGAAALFMGPLALTRGASGTLYVCDSDGSCIRMVDPSGNVTTIAGSTGQGGSSDGTGNVATFEEPQAIAVSADETELFVADTDANKIRRIALTPGQSPNNAGNWNVTTIAGTTTQGFADGVGSSAGFNEPAGIALNGENQLYVSETQGARIRAVRFLGGDRSSSSDWQVSTIAGDNSQSIGATGLVNGQGTNARFNTPLGLCQDGHGNLFVADFGNSVIRKIDSAGNVTTFVGTGTAGYQDGTAGNAEFHAPPQVAFDSAGYLYVTDELNNAIRRVSPSGQVSTVAGTTATGFADGPGNVAEFHSPTGIVISPSGTMYITDYQNRNIRLIQDVVSQASGPRKR